MQKKTGGAHLSVEIITVSAMLTAISVILGIICKNLFTVSVYYRFTLENLGIITAGIFFGPLPGALVGLAADAISCILSTNPALNPIISAGAVAVGVISGLMPRILHIGDNAKLAVTVGTAHLIGQVLIKSIGKMIYFGMPWYGIFIGLGCSLVSGIVEFFVIRAVSRNKQVKNFLNRVKKTK